MNAEDRKRVLAGKAPVKKKPGKRDEAPPMTTGQSVMSWVKTIVTSLLIVMVVNGLLIASFVVPTGSMEDEVMTGDFVFVNKFVYGGSTPQTIPFIDVPLPYFRFPGIRQPEKGDVIVFIFPGYRDQVKADQFQYYLKRCVATAGDTLQVRNATVFVNGKEQPVPRHAKFDQDHAAIQPGDNSRIFPDGSGFSRDNWGPMRIPKKGDVIPLNDSTYYFYRIFIAREGHEVERNGQIITIDGKAANAYTVERDYCFGMGDNRWNSLDSRYWGFVPVENVVGTPLFVYWSWNTDEPNFFKKFGTIRWSRIFSGVN
ncbi:MAG: signal peptidase I [Bacteroidetes bacterium]|nr:signal peptidase I [Bacteroidota bacterium]